MTVFQKVTLASLRKNKVRTVVTVIGILLSAAMICAVTTFVSSLHEYALQSTVYSTGDWHGCELNTTFDTVTTLTASDEVAHTAFGRHVGYADIHSKNEYKPYLYVLGVNGVFLDTMPLHLTEGTYPADSTQLLLPDHLADNGGVFYKIGDTLTLELGERINEDVRLTQQNPCYYYDDSGEEYHNGEALVISDTRTYTVVGFYERPSFEEYTAPGYTAITREDTPQIGERYDVFFKMHDADSIYGFIKEQGLAGDTNSDVLMLSGVFRYSSFSTMLNQLAIIVMALIMLGSVSLIYNAFSISVSERTRQFGLLSSIGATRRQLRRMVLFEAFAVSLIGIPLGIAVGVGGIGITLQLIGQKFAALTSFPGSMSLSVSPLSIVTAIVVALVTVLISAWIPSKRATKIAAVEAIRQNVDIKPPRRPVKSSKLTYRLFGLPGVLARQHYKRNKKKYRTTVLSLFMSIVLFVSSAAFTDYLTDSVGDGFGTNGYDLLFYTTEEDLTAVSADGLLEQLCAEAHVQSGAYVQQTGQIGTVSTDLLTEEYLAEQELYGFSDETVGTEVSLSTSVIFVNDEAFLQMLEQYHLDEARFFNAAQPLAVTVDSSVVFDREQGKYVSVQTLSGDELTVTLSVAKTVEGYDLVDIVDDENGALQYRYRAENGPHDLLILSAEDATIRYTLTSGKTLREHPFFLDTNMIGVVMIYPQSFKNTVLPQTDFSQNTYVYKFIAEDHTAGYQGLRQILLDLHFNSDNLTDYAQQVERSRDMVLIVQVFSSGFIVLISLIAAANVFNTISTNIHLRRREFAMLKSVGMTDKGLYRMMHFECLLYGTKSLLYGLPVAAIVTYLIYGAVSEGFETAFQLPWTAILIAVLSVFAVVFSSMLYAMRKIQKDNPLDALRNENL